MRIRKTRRADADIRALFRLMRSYDRQAAMNFAMRLDAGFRTLASHPYCGRECPELGPGVRRLVVGMTLLFYTVEPEYILILRALDGRMDVDAEFLN